MTRAAGAGAHAGAGGGYRPPMFDKLKGNDEKPDKPESDAPQDDGVAFDRSTGGVPHEGAPDANETTGTTPNEKFVGRVSGQDVGYEEEQGAETRAAAGGPEGYSQDP